MSARQTRTRLQQEVTAQQRWMAERGGTLAGYVARYGGPVGPDDDGAGYGAGGAAIYRADRARLVTLQAQYAQAVAR